MRNLYLVGFMAAGKTSAGTALARRLDRRFVDLDEVLAARFGVTIAEVFASLGEPAFRTAEREAVRETGRLDRAVVAVGGGAFCDPANREIMHEHGCSVFLDVAWAALAERLAADHDGRPRFRGLADAERLYRQRRPHYLAATWTVALEGPETPADVAGLVAEAVSGAACAT